MTIDIQLLYVAQSGCECSFQDLNAKRQYIDIYEFDDREGAHVPAGGISLFTDRYLCFLRSVNGEDLSTYTMFLISSLLGLHRGPLTREQRMWISDEAVFGLDDVIARVYESPDFIYLRNFGDEVSLNYVNGDGDVLEGRGSLYFKDFMIPASEWRAAAVIALQEFQSVATEQIMPLATAHQQEQYVDSLRKQLSIIELLQRTQ